jgi:hypothetical protein
MFRLRLEQEISMANRRTETHVGDKPNEPVTSMPPEAGGEGSDDRLSRIACAAYLRASTRNFNGGDPVEDWLQAEMEIDSALKAR